MVCDIFQEVANSITTQSTDNLDMLLSYTASHPRLLQSSHPSLTEISALT